MSDILNRVFQIWAYTVSHSFLILRSPMKFPDQDDSNELYDCNIDIEFSAVAYLDLPNILKGIEIGELTRCIPKKLIHYRKDLGFKIFEIKSENNIFYVVAGNYRIGKNKWLIEDRVINSNLEYDEILAKS
ncbi:hypothetical protein DBR40_10550 [Pedobacter sp. KBW01]|uniref:hypothetical protein n=1 Tax=Pedobacter sp. KBW01 TaxID=2153364 RepID=UPI000F5B6539|nr:hypothetical protein [Pedobacter sp. KBW01]RQO77095.1 hypothetical protein DBR40_10550 [Pedobacter sp. KBW01]